MVVKGGKGRGLLELTCWLLRVSEVWRVWLCGLVWLGKEGTSCSKGGYELLKGRVRFTAWCAVAGLTLESVLDVWVPRLGTDPKFGNQQLDTKVAGVGAVPHNKNI